MKSTTIVHNVLSLTQILFGWLVGFYGISTFVGYLTPNPFLCIIDSSILDNLFEYENTI